MRSLCGPSPASSSCLCSRRFVMWRRAFGRHEPSCNSSSKPTQFYTLACRSASRRRYAKSSCGG
ncbi:hypothetical protein PybrP1_012872 [[Pythium] brassicae (nom. inval.)]|nr:hypothetical protein PybrP1_012872 [[Pythium] brassicae (nom. inval.)]